MSYPELPFSPSADLIAERDRVFKEEKELRNATSCEAVLKEEGHHQILFAVEYPSVDGNERSARIPCLTHFVKDGVEAKKSSPTEPFIFDGVDVSSKTETQWREMVAKGFNRMGVR